jgi:hypothetical protein
LFVTASEREPNQEDFLPKSRDFVISRGGRVLKEDLAKPGRQCLRRTFRASGGLWRANLLVRHSDFMIASVRDQTLVAHRFAAIRIQAITGFSRRGGIPLESAVRVRVGFPIEISFRI